MAGPEVPRKSPPPSRPAPLRGEQWRFTFADLKQLNGKLALARDPASAWVSAKLADNIFGIVKYVLDPANAEDGIPLSLEISVRDFYHGHLIVPQNEQIPGGIRQDLDQLDLDHRDLITKAYRLAYQVTFPGGAAPTDDERAAIRKADVEIAGRLGQMLQRIERELPHLCISYHTYEHVKIEQLQRQDDRGWRGRNLLTAFAGDRCSAGPRSREEDLIKDPVRTATVNQRQAGTESRKEKMLLDGVGPGVPPRPPAAAPVLGIAADDHPSVLHVDFLINPRGEVFIRHGSVSLLGLEFTA
jgi:hypothetical protein